MYSINNTVHVIDDDDAIRAALGNLLKSEDIEGRFYPSAEEFLVDVSSEEYGCVLTDVRMPGVSGLELIEKMKERSIYMPIVMMTGYSEVDVAVRAMKDGVMDYIEKPFESENLVNVVRNCLLQSKAYRDGEIYKNKIGKKLQSLTPRERQVMDFLVGGLQNKEIARKLDISPRTVELHRAKVMEKLSAHTVSDVVRAGVIAE